jgi:hypothetical protein
MSYLIWISHHVIEDMLKILTDLRKIIYSMFIIALKKKQKSSKILSILMLYIKSECYKNSYNLMQWVYSRVRMWYILCLNKHYFHKNNDSFESYYEFYRKISRIMQFCRKKKQKDIDFQLSFFRMKTSYFVSKILI